MDFQYFLKIPENTSDTETKSETVEIHSILTWPVVLEDLYTRSSYVKYCVPIWNQLDTHLLTEQRSKL